MYNIFILSMLILTFAIMELWGAILVSVLFGGFIAIVVNSDRYPKINNFFNTVF